MFIHVIEGDGPVIITVPHDGWVFDPQEPMREQVRRWIRRRGADPRDEGTLEIAFRVRSLFARDGPTPTVILSKLHRSHMDPNRGPRGQPFVNGFGAAYRAFHNTFDQQIRRVRNKYGPVIHIDLHGFIQPAGLQHFDAFIGTRSGETSPQGLDRLLVRGLHQTGVSAARSPDVSRGIRGCYRGGWIVARAADDHYGDVESFQLELHASRRETTQRADTARHIATALRGLPNF